MGSLLRKVLPDVSEGLVVHIGWDAVVSGIIIGVLVAMVKDRMSDPLGRQKRVAIVRRAHR